MKSTDRILQLIKAQGDLTAGMLAEQLEMTSMGARQHLQQLEAEGMLECYDRKAARGRPTRVWRLTELGHQSFGDRHEELTLQLIDAVRDTFGEQGLEQLIQHREKASFTHYQAALDGLPVHRKLEKLAQLRTNEGYMAAVEVGEGHYWLLENHCPICAAATKCQNFCRSELEIFQRLLEGEATVEREQHIVQGAKRCAYRITPIKPI